MSAGLEASTETPGKTPPDASRTVPVIDACANAIAGTKMQVATRTAERCALLSAMMDPC